MMYVNAAIIIVLALLILVVWRWVKGMLRVSLLALIVGYALGSEFGVHNVSNYLIHLLK